MSTQSLSQCLRLWIDLIRALLQSSSGGVCLSWINHGVKHIQLLHSFKEKQRKKLPRQQNSICSPLVKHARSRQGAQGFSNRVRVFRAEMSTAFCSAKHTVRLSTTGCSRACFKYLYSQLFSGTTYKHVFLSRCLKKSAKCIRPAGLNECAMLDCTVMILYKQNKNSALLPFSIRSTWKGCSNFHII